MPPLIKSPPVPFGRLDARCTEMQKQKQRWWLESFLGSYGKKFCVHSAKIIAFLQDVSSFSLDQCSLEQYSIVQKASLLLVRFLIISNNGEVMRNRSFGATDKVGRCLTVVSFSLGNTSLKRSRQCRKSLIFPYLGRQRSSFSRFLFLKKIGIVHCYGMLALHSATLSQTSEFCCTSPATPTTTSARVQASHQQG